MYTKVEPSCGRRTTPIHSTSYSAAQPLERGSNHYYSINIRKDNNMRKGISLVLTITLLMCSLLPCTAFAVEATSEKPVYFATEDCAMTQFGVANSAVTYSDFDIQEFSGIDGKNYRMKFSLNVGKSTYDVVVTGLLDEYDIDTDCRILHGCLRGDVKINETWYAITVGLTKEIDNDSVNAGVVMMPYGDTWSDDVIVFSMGDYVMPREVQALLLGDRFYTVEDVVEPEQNSVASIDSTLGDVLSIEAGIADSIAQSIRVHVTPDIDAVRDYVNEHYSYTGTGGGVGFSLYSLQAGVRESSSYFTMAGVFTDHVENDTDYEDFKSFIWAVICDALSYYGVPTSTLSALLEYRTSDPVDTDSPNNCSITLSGSKLYDDVETYGVAGEFATAPNTSLTPGSGYATAYGNATFRIVQNIPFSGPTSFYMDANEVTESVRVTVG